MTARFMRYRTPIDLSDLPDYERSQRGPRVSVLVDRVSTKDNQNPFASIPRQVEHASCRLEPEEEFIGFFWDMERVGSRRVGLVWS